jgi:hypothetical protein
MKKMIVMAAAMSLMAPAATPAFAQNKSPVLYETGGKTYRSLSECQRAKKRAKDRGTVAGAVAAGAGAALLGGNLAETALVAGGGALVGRELGKKSRPRQC